MSVLGGIDREAHEAVLKLEFDRVRCSQCHACTRPLQPDWMPYRERDGVPGLTAMASDVQAGARTGKNGRHGLAARQSGVARLRPVMAATSAGRARAKALRMLLFRRKRVSPIRQERKG